MSSSTSGPRSSSPTISPPAASQASRSTGPTTTASRARAPCRWRRCRGSPEIGVGITTLFAVFDSHDAITFAHEALSTPSGDVRLVPVLDAAGAARRAARAGVGAGPSGRRGRQPVALRPARGAGAAGRRRWPRQGLTALVGYEMEFGGDHGAETSSPPTPAPPTARTRSCRLDAFVADVLHDCAANGLPIGQLHAEYGPAQMELSLGRDRPGHARPTASCWPARPCAPPRTATACG